MHAIPFGIRTFALSLLLLFGTPLETANYDGGHETLFALINERLSYMEQVALYKHHNDLAIEDQQRERMVIDDSKLVASRRGLDPESIEGFFAAQIAVAKAIQYRHLADWQSTPTTAQPLDLANRIRPAITDLGELIIANIALLLQSGKSVDEQHRQLFHEAMAVANLTESDKDLLFESLIAVKAEPTAQRN